MLTSSNSPLVFPPAALTPTTSITAKTPTSITTTATPTTSPTTIPDTSTTTSKTSTLPITSMSTTSKNVMELPTLVNAIPSYVVEAAPPMQNNPFVENSNLPEGTVFIVVGASLAGAIFFFLTWRILATWILRISRNDKHSQIEKNPFLTKRANGAMYSENHGSTISVDAVARIGELPTPSSNRFSAASTTFDGLRNSQYLPAGYYSTGSPIKPPAARGSPPNTSGSQTRLTGLSGTNGGLQPTPHLNTGSRQSRAPSAYLEDLLGNQREH